MSSQDPAQSPSQPQPAQPDRSAEQPRPAPQGQPYPYSASQGQQSYPAQQPPGGLAPAWPQQAWPTPVQAPPVAQQPAGGGFKRGFGAGAGAGLGLGAVLAVGMVVSSLVFGLLAGAAAMGGTTTSAMRTIWGPENAANTIRAVSVTGVILADASDGATLTGGTYGYEIARQIDGLQADDAAGLLLVMNTPGGTIHGSKAIADAVARYQERTGKRVVASVQGMSASGGMYAMAGADEIISDHGSLIGSIGVIMGPFERYRDVTGTTGTLFTPGVQTSGGIEQEYLTMGKGKDFGNPFRDMSAEERTVMTAALQNIYDDFVNWVAEGRDLQPAVITDTLGAHIFDPQTAIEHGLVDAELGIDEAYRRAAEVMGVEPENTRIVTPAAPSMLEQLLGVENRVPGHAVALEPGQAPAVSFCGRTPTALVYHGEPAAICG